MSMMNQRRASHWYSWWTKGRPNGSWRYRPTTSGKGNIFFVRGRQRSNRGDWWTLFRWFIVQPQFDQRIWSLWNISFLEWKGIVGTDDFFFFPVIRTRIFKDVGSDLVPERERRRWSGSEIELAGDIERGSSWRCIRVWCISSLLAHYGRWSNITDGVYFCRRRGKPDANLFEERKAEFGFNEDFRQSSNTKVSPLLILTRYR